MSKHRMNLNSQQTNQNLGHAFLSWSFVQCVVLLLTVTVLGGFVHQLKAQDDLDSDTSALLDQWKQQQDAIQKMLPDLEAATVCLEAGGGSGSGVIVNEEGLIVTAAHVVDGQKEMTVRFANGKVMRCKVLGGYRPADAALAQIIDPGPHPYVKMAKSGTVKKGQTIIALGNPSGFDEHRGLPLRLGHIRAIESYQYRSDCALIGGDSGGPGFNLQGELIGIHSTISSDVSTNNDILIDIYHREWDSMLEGEWRGDQLFQPEDQQDGQQQSSFRSAPGPALQVRHRQNNYLHLQQQDGATKQDDDDPEEGEQDPEEQDDDEKTELQRLFDKSQSENGQLTVEREKLLELRKNLRKRMDSLAPAGGRSEDRWTRSFESVFSKHVKNYSRSVFPVFVVGRHVASAVVVDSSGILLTKLSEIEGRRPQLRMNDESMIEVEIISTDNHLDLALVQVLPEDIEVAEWIPVALGDNENVSTTNATGDDPAAKGTVCCSISSRKERAAGLGIVSVASRSLDGRTTSFIGVETTVEDNGIRVSSMMKGGPAERAGVKVGDIINGLNNQPVANVEDFKKLVESHLPGEQVQLGIIRQDSWLTLPATLGDKSKVAPMPGAAEQGHDSAATAMSRRRWNFTQGIQHDCAIPPKACGGLLIDLDGRVIGINIARAGRIKSYAIPASLAKQFIDSYLNGKGASE